jgi:hypothetical protein
MEDMADIIIEGWSTNDQNTFGALVLDRGKVNVDRCCNSHKVACCAIKQIT